MKFLQCILRYVNNHFFSHEVYNIRPLFVVDSKEDLVYGVVGYPKYTYLSYGYNSIQLLHGLNQIGKIYSR